MSEADARELVKRSREDQGLAPVVEDVVTLRRLAGLLVNNVERTAGMAGRQSAAADIAARVKKVPGWEVTRPRSVSGAWKIKAPNGVVTQVHTSPSDVNFEKTIWRRLNALGFEDDEKRAESSQQNGKQERLKAGVETADRLAAEMVERARAVSVAKAAGPYLVQVEEVGIMWFAEAHPAPWHRWVWMTPEIARYLLANHNKPGHGGEEGTNRPKSAKQITHYRDIILCGQWHLTHQGMASDVDANVQDGQHRLEAICAAQDLVDEVLLEPGEYPEHLVCIAQEFQGRGGIKVPTAYTVGMPRENFKALDEGMLRTAAQLFARAGEKHDKTLQGAIRLITAYNDIGNVRGRIRLRMTNQQVLDSFEASSDLLREAAQFASRNYLKTRLTVGVLAAGYYLIRSVHEPDNRFVAAFFQGLVTGAKGESRVMLDDDDPRETLRRALERAKDQGKRLTGIEQLGMLIKSWNNLISNHHPRSLNWSPGETAIPRINLCKDDRPGLVGVPRALVGEIQ